MKPTLVMTLVVLLGLIAGAGCTHDATDDSGAGAAATQGEARSAATAAAAAPSTDFVLSDLNGAQLSLVDFRGDVVILDFWATWCGPCKVVMPFLQKIHDDHAAEGIRVVALSVDQQGPSIVRRFIDKYGYTFPIAMAGADLQQAFGGITSIPTTFIIGPDGTVKEKMVGSHPMNDYLAAARRAKQAGTGN